MGILDVRISENLNYIEIYFREKIEAVSGLFKKNILDQENCDLVLIDSFKKKLG